MLLLLQYRVVGYRLFTLLLQYRVMGYRWFTLLLQYRVVGYRWFTLLLQYRVVGYRLFTLLLQYRVVGYKWFTLLLQYRVVGYKCSMICTPSVESSTLLQNLRVGLCNFGAGLCNPRWVGDANVFNELEALLNMKNSLKPVTPFTSDD